MDTTGISTRQIIFIVWLFVAVRKLSDSFTILRLERKKVIVYDKTMDILSINQWNWNPRGYPPNLIDIKIIDGNDYSYASEWPFWDHFISIFNTWELPLVKTLYSSICQKITHSTTWTFTSSRFYNIWFNWNSKCNKIKCNDELFFFENKQFSSI